MNRKLIRPSLNDMKEREPYRGSQPPPRSNERHAPHDGDSADALAAKNRRVPQTETNAEIFYYKKQIDSHTAMVIVLQDGEEIEGTIEWYDRNALKINRQNAPNLMLLKHNIKYMFKAEDRVS